jgi:hypothetical protein
MGSSSQWAQGNTSWHIMVKRVEDHTTTPRCRVLQTCAQTTHGLKLASAIVQTGQR